MWGFHDNGGDGSGCSGNGGDGGGCSGGAGGDGAAADDDDDLLGLRPEEGDCVSVKCWHLPVNLHGTKTQKNIISWETCLVS